MAQSLAMKCSQNSARGTLWSTKWPTRAQRLESFIYRTNGCFGHQIVSEYHPHTRVGQDYLTTLAPELFFIICEFLHGEHSINLDDLGSAHDLLALGGSCRKSTSLVGSYVKPQVLEMNPGTEISCFRYLSTMTRGKFTVPVLEDSAALILRKLRDLGSLCELEIVYNNDKDSVTEEQLQTFISSLCSKTSTLPKLTFSPQPLIPTQAAGSFLKHIDLDFDLDDGNETDVTKSITRTFQHSRVESLSINGHGQSAFIWFFSQMSTSYLTILNLRYWSIPTREVRNMIHRASSLKKLTLANEEHNSRLFELFFWGGPSSSIKGDKSIELKHLKFLSLQGSTLRHWILRIQDLLSLFNSLEQLEFSDMVLPSDGRLSLFIQQRRPSLRLVLHGVTGYSPRSSSCLVSGEVQDGWSPLHSALWNHDEKGILDNASKYITQTTVEGWTPKELAHLWNPEKVAGLDVGSAVWLKSLLPEFEPVISMLTKDGKTLSEIKNVIKDCVIGSSSYTNWANPLWNLFHSLVASAHHDIYLEFAKQMLNLGTDINCLNMIGRTALHQLLYQGHDFPEDRLRLRLEFLVEHGADCYATDDYGWGVAHFLATSNLSLGLLETIGWNIASYTDNAQRFTPLHAASRYGADEAMLTGFIEQGFDPLQSDSLGRNCLHYSAMNGNELIVRFFLRDYSVLNDRDVDGHTPLWWAVRQGSSSVVNLLLEVSTADKLNMADVAISYGNEHLVHLLKTTPSRHERSRIWPFMQCESCGLPVYDVRYRCGSCHDFDLCSTCRKSPHRHRLKELVRIDYIFRPKTNDSSDLRSPYELCPRGTSPA